MEDGYERYCLSDANEITNVQAQNKIDSTALRKLPMREDDCSDQRPHWSQGGGVNDQEYDTISNRSEYEELQVDYTNITKLARYQNQSPDMRRVDGFANAKVRFPPPPLPKAPKGKIK